jgi:hypothetical protein
MTSHRYWKEKHYKKEQCLCPIFFWNGDVRVESALPRYTSKFGDGWKTKMQIKAIKYKKHGTAVAKMLNCPKFLQSCRKSDFTALLKMGIENVTRVNSIIIIHQSI